MNQTTIQHASLQHDEIARCAYLLWEHEGKPTGRDQEYWFRAQELLTQAETQIKQAARAAGDNTEAASVQPPSVVAVSASPVVRRLVAPAALPVAGIQLETGRRSPRRKRRATS
jgi:hypothetical protein